LGQPGGGRLDPAAVQAELLAVVIMLSILSPELQPFAALQHTTVVMQPTAVGPPPAQDN